MRELINCGYQVISNTTDSFRGKLLAPGRKISNEREVLIFDTETSSFTTLCYQLVVRINNLTALQEKLDTIIQFVSEQFSAGQSFNKITQILEDKNHQTTDIKQEKIPVISLQTFLDRKVGTCRHFALLTACLVDSMIERNQLPKGNLHLIRGDTSSGRHALVGYKPESSNDIYLLDAMNNRRALCLSEGYDKSDADSHYGSEITGSIVTFYNNPSQTFHLDFNRNDGISQAYMQTIDVEKHCERKFSALKDDIIATVNTRITALRNQVTKNRVFSDTLTKRNKIAMLNALIEKIRGRYSYEDFKLSVRISDLIAEVKNENKEIASNLEAGVNSETKRMLESIQSKEEIFLEDVLRLRFSKMIDGIIDSINDRIKQLEKELGSKFTAFRTIFSEEPKKVKEDKIAGLQAIREKIRELFPRTYLPTKNMPSVRAIVEQAKSSIAQAEHLEQGKRSKTHSTLEDAHNEFENFRGSTFGMRLTSTV